jgi:hypothetical protein
MKLNLTVEGIKAAFDRLCLRPIKRAFFRKGRRQANCGACALGALAAAALTGPDGVPPTEDNIVSFLRDEIKDLPFRYGVQDGWDECRKPLPFRDPTEEASYERGYKLGSEALALVTKERGLHEACNI